MASITNNQLASFAADQLESGVKSSDLANQLAAFLTKERRTRDASTLFRLLEAEMSKRGKTQVTVISSYEVSEDVKKQLAKLLDVETPIFHEVIEPNVIGGVKARANESEIDLTVRGRLNRFKQQVISSK